MNESFEAFYTATAKRTFAAAYRSAGNRAVAEDATHEAYAAMLATWPNREHHAQHVNHRYVIGIAAHKVVDWYRSADRFTPLPDRDVLAATDGTGDDYPSLYREVRRVLQSRPVVSRTVGVLYFLEGFTPTEVADTLDMAPSTVRTHLQRLRELLRPLAERWLDGRRYRDA